MFLQSITSIITIVLLIALGYGLKSMQWFDEGFMRGISSLITKVALPASIFVSVLKFLTRDSLISLSSSLIYTLGAVAICYLIAFAPVKIFKIPAGHRGVFINTIANANTIFIGMPLNIALFGEKATPFFLVYYVTNTVSTWAFGASLIANDDPTRESSSHKIDWRKIMSPPLVGFIVSIVFLLLAIPVPTFINSALTYTGNLVTPLSLIYIGIVLYDAGLKSIKFDRDTSLALLGRFIISPLVLVALIIIGQHVFGQNLSVGLRQTIIVQSAVPALAVLPILANEAHGDVKYATNVVTTSTLLFVIVIPILMQLIQFM